MSPYSAHYSPHWFVVKFNAFHEPLRKTGEAKLKQNPVQA